MNKSNQCSCQTSKPSPTTDSRFDVGCGAAKEGPIMEKISRIFKVIDNMNTEFAYLNDKLTPIINVVDVGVAVADPLLDSDQLCVNSILYKRLSEIEILLNHHTSRIIGIKELITL